ncbi:MAG TPA: PLP-dependent aminotransferase family protein [Candidatus Limnocylindria bacterium]|nr:PLP-dependent aminotransferase family protein [Candidatus Limnocylindria bacterium]
MELPLIELDPESGLPLYRQLYEGLRRAIVSGRLARGTRLPSTRALAEVLGVSRTTLTSTFAQLVSEGYLEAAVGSGTFVSTELPDETPRGGAAATPRESGPSFRLSAYGATLLEAEPLEPPRVPGTIDFRDGRPAFDHFPYAAWRRCIARHLRGGTHAFDYSPDPAGLRPLREAIAAYLGRARAVHCDPADVVIVTGSQQAIDLVARILIEPRDVVALEDPGYPGAQRTFSAHGADVRGVPVDGEGLRVDLLRELDGPVRLVYVTPSHQFPLGAVLPLWRRLELLRWAEQTEAIIVEDDYDSAYRYEGRPIPALQGLDTHGRVVYVGTFSKTMFPALRIGYVVAPRRLRDVVIAAKAFSDRQSPVLEQHALADFIAEGSFERHLRRMRVLYRERRAALLAALRRHIGEDAEVVGERAGMHLVVRLRGVDEAALVQRARRAGVVLTSTRAHYLDGGLRGEFVFGFAEHTQETIDEGVARLAAALRAVSS